MSDTTRLALPRLDAAQAQKHVTHNEALGLLDVLVHLSLSARNVAAPPAAAVEGARCIVGATPTGAFAGQAGKVAAFDDGAWRFLTPRKGWCAFVESENRLVVFDGAGWTLLAVDIAEAQNLRRLGVGATADANTPLLARLNAAAFTALRVADGGSGDLRVKLDKQQASNTASQLYQSNWSGRAETGLIGDDAYRIKVSADGLVWKDALSVNPATGRVSFPNGLTDLVGADPANPAIAKANTFTYTSWPTGEGGTGDLRFKLNRQQGSNTASQLYQSNWSGRAETGLIGDDFYRIKVSADGASWKEALTVDSVTGRVVFPYGATDLTAAAVATTGTPAAYLLNAPLSGPLPDGALVWMVPHVPNATALNVDPTLQIDRIDATPLPLRAFDGTPLSQGALEAGRAILLRKVSGIYCVQTIRQAASPINLLEDGGRFAGNPEPVTGAVTTFADSTCFTSANSAVRASYGLVRIGAAMPAPLPDLIAKIRTPAAQLAGAEFFVLKVTAGAGTTLGVTVQGVTYYAPLTAARATGRGVTASLYFRVLSGALVMAPSDTVPRMLIDGVAHIFSASTPDRVFADAQGWKHMQMWIAPPNGASTAFWPMRVTPGTVFLIALPAITQGFETIPWDIGPMPSQRGWR